MHGTLRNLGPSAYVRWWHSRQPCRLIAGAVFLLCKAHEQLADPTYLRAAERSGESVWERGLLKKGPGGHQRHLSSSTPIGPTPNCPTC